MPTPNMGLTLPTDKGSADIWDVILDTAFGVIDQHNHAPGAGAQILQSTVKVDADISWASGGSKFAITDLKAIDFFPVDPSTVNGLSGAFFLSTDQNLYFRNTTGTNIQITNGAVLNSAAFVGGIGGDYSAVSALEIYDDSSDAYWFQQQVGASVRQYAKMQCSDVKLFEFKAVGASPVPSFGVTLKSPAALAANYALTLPGALPGSTKVLNVDSSGNITASGVVSSGATLDRMFNAANIQPTTGGGAFDTTALHLLTTTGSNMAPLVMNIGEVITGWTVYLQKNSAAGTIQAVLVDLPPTGVGVNIGSIQSNGASSPGNITLSQSGLSTTVTAGHSYWINILGGGTTGDTVFSYRVTHT